jgi:hypothetical protein
MGVDVFVASCRSRKVCGRLSHFEPDGVDWRSFLLGESSGMDGLQIKPDLFFIKKRGDVDSLQSPVCTLVNRHGSYKREPYHTSRSIGTRWRQRLEDIACEILGT